MNKSLQILSLAFLLSIPATNAAVAAERLVDGILGGAAGGLVLGPVGMVGGALIGATAGPGIASSWGLRRTRTVHRYRRPARY